MPSLDVIELPVKFHLSLNVPDLNRAIDFYRVLFGRPPAKRHDDYAKFELDDPPVVFSLVPHPPGPGASLSHLGFRVGTAAAIQEYRDRLEAAGICTQAQDGTVCGYAKQNKLWVKDPFGNFWDIYHIEGDIPPESVRTSVEGTAARVDAEPTAESVAWEHFVANPLPDRIPHADATVDEVRLVGSFNADLSEDQRAFLVGEAARVLKPGGKVLTHGLMADKPFPRSQPKLSGLAAMVSRVPVQGEPIDAFRQAGFVGVQLVKFDKPWFTHDGVELREVKMIAWKPAATPTAETRQVLYKGPFATATADGGHAFHRGQRTTVPLAVWQQLRHGPSAEQFLFFEPGQPSACSTS
ncbi:ArsI/CadI family heavy metal resistance metalloenzyme [Limnoglobus roseus]|uniref:Methyltransferase domain-containing protein n=1 Tax=Limnoglobus roseus TaxID=2598579 RepID=A0A5C1A719_9BACT|nr:ArsI/CadI family heavy metal resistance metalloenzyme [Limnoglobus roseus]QEL14991.1 methyltransferase domain-containing protein [Limnoglobus roseus]